MKIRFASTACAAVLSAVFFLSASTAEAARPASIAGAWRVVGNQTLGILNIVQAAAVTQCRNIAGNIYGNPIEGVYCPASGQIVFVRKAAGGTPFQLYSGFVSQDGATDRIGGTLIIWNAAGGAATVDGPAYNFSATK